MTSFFIFSNWRVQTCLSIFRHYDLLHSEPFSSDTCSDSCGFLYSCLFACCLLLVFFFSSCFCLSLRQILAEAEKASVKDEGRLLTDCAYEALTLWACMFLILLKCKFTCILSGATGYCFFDRKIISMVIHLSLFTCPINHIKVKIYWHDKSSPELTAPNIEPCSQPDRQTNTQTDTHSS